MCVDAEARDLREIRRCGEVEHVHVIKDVVPVEPAKDEEPRIGKERGVITPWRRRAAKRRARLVLQRHEIEEEQLWGILRSVVPTGNEKIGTYL